MLRWADANATSIAALAEAAECSGAHLRNIFAGRKEASLGLAKRLSEISGGEVPMDAFLRQGCLLVPDTATPAQWTLVGRKGDRPSLEMREDIIQEYATAAAKAFGKGADRRVTFDKARAKDDAKKADKKGKAA